MIAAWSVFGPAGREAFRGALDPGDGAWARARGIALHQAVMLIPYYREANPGMAALGRRTVGEVLADLKALHKPLPPEVMGPAVPTRNSGTRADHQPGQNRFSTLVIGPSQPEPAYPRIWLHTMKQLPNGAGAQVPSGG